MIPRSAKLMTRLIESEEFSADDLARELLVSTETFDGYLTGAAIMPLSRQLVLAKLVIAKSKAHRQQGNTLLAQVIAATGFHSKRTISHQEPPHTWKGRIR